MPWPEPRATSTGIALKPVGTNRRAILGALIFVALFATLVYGWRLGASAIANADEGVHALVTREIRESGNWIDLTIREKPYFRKPPLAFWFRAATQSVFGENELTARIPSAVAGVATTTLLAWWAWQATRRMRAVLAAGFIFPLLPITFSHTFRSGETDGLLLLLLTIGAYLCWRSLERRWLIVGAAAVIGLAFMTKSVAAGVVPIGFGLALLLHRRWPYTWRQTTAAVVTFLAVMLPWHLAELIRHGRTFWDEYVGFHIIQRVETKLHVTPKLHGTLWYAPAFEQGMFPWSWLSFPAIAAAFRRIRRRIPTDGPFLDTFLLAWGVGTVVLFTLAATKLAWYIAPAYPAFTLLIARFLAEPFGEQPRWLRVLAGAAVTAYLYRTFVLYRTGFGGTLALRFFSPPVALAIVVLVAITFLVLAYRRSAMAGRRALSVLALGTILHLSLVSAVIYSRNVRRTYESPFRVFRNDVVARDPSAAVYFYDIGYITSPLAWIYLGGQQADRRRLTALLEKPERLEQAIQDDPGAFVVFERARTIDSAVQERLQFVDAFDALVLYRIPPRENSLR